jgi:hypothetical protein
MYVMCTNAETCIVWLQVHVIELVHTMLIADELIKSDNAYVRVSVTHDADN